MRQPTQTDFARWLTFALLFATVEIAPAEEPQASDRQESLYGAWDVYNAYMSGESAFHPDYPGGKYGVLNEELVFADDQVTIRPKGGREFVFRALYDFCEKSDVILLDMWRTNPRTGQETAWKIILRVDGDFLQFCGVPNDKLPRPTEFTTTYGDQRQYFRLRRIQPELDE